MEKENLRSVYKQKVDEMRKAEQQLARKQREFEEMAACRQRDLAKAEDAEQGHLPTNPATMFGDA